MVKAWEATYTLFTRDTKQYPSDVEMEYLMIGLANEVGEVLGKYKKHLRGDTMVLEDLRTKLIAEMGDVLFSLVNLSRFLDINPEDALRMTISKFETRFAQVEKELKKRGKSLTDSTLEEMDEIWNLVKKKARA